MTVRPNKFVWIKPRDWKKGKEGAREEDVTKQTDSVCFGLE
jgi:hypothetical protein